MRDYYSGETIMKERFRTDRSDLLTEQAMNEYDLWNRKWRSSEERFKFMTSMKGLAFGFALGAICWWALWTYVIHPLI